MRRQKLFPAVIAQEGEFGHVFRKTHFHTPTWCKLCDNFIWGLGRQGYQCEACKYSAHKACVAKAPNNCFKAFKLPRYESFYTVRGADAAAAVAALESGGGVVGADGAIASPAATERLDLSREAPVRPPLGPGPGPGPAASPLVRRRPGPAGPAPSLGGLSSASAGRLGGGGGADEAHPSHEALRPGVAPPPSTASPATAGKGALLGREGWRFLGEKNLDLPALAPDGAGSRKSPARSRPLSPGPMPSSTSPRDANDPELVAIHVENLRLESHRVCMKNEFYSDRVERGRRQRDGAEEELERSLAATHAVQARIARAEASVNELHAAARRHVTALFGQLAEVLAALKTCTARYKDLATAAVEAEETGADGAVPRKHLLGLQTIGLNLEDLLNCESLLKVHGTRLDRARVQLRAYGDVLEKRLSTIERVEAELRDSDEQMRRDIAQLVILRDVLRRLDAAMAAVRLEQLPSRDVQVLLYDINTCIKSFSTPIAPAESAPAAAAAGDAAAPRPLPAHDRGDITYLGTGPQRVVKAAAVDRLVELLTPETGNDVDFQRRFLLVYRSFMEPVELLEKLVLRYCVTPPVSVTDLAAAKTSRQLPVRLRVLNVLRFWLDDHFDDFEEGRFMQILVDFLENTVSHTSNRAFAESFLLALFRKRHSRTAPAATFADSPPPIVPDLAARGDLLSLADIDAVELARQLTLHQQALFRAVQLHELLGLAWLQPDRTRTAPTLHAVLLHLANMSAWVVSEVVGDHALPSRRLKVAKLVQVARELHRLRNLGGCVAVLEGLLNPAVFRLDRTWDGLDLNRYTELKGLTEDDYRALAQQQRQLRPPCVPYLGVVLAELQQLDEGTPDVVGGAGLVNWYKRDQIAGRLMELRRWQLEPYHLQRVPPILDYVLHFALLPPHEVDERSARLEALVETM